MKYIFHNQQKWCWSVISSINVECFCSPSDCLLSSCSIFFSTFCCCRCLLYSEFSVLSAFLTFKHCNHLSGKIRTRHRLLLFPALILFMLCNSLVRRTSSRALPSFFTPISQLDKLNFGFFRRPDSIRAKIGCGHQKNIPENSKGRRGAWIRWRPLL